MTTRIPDNSLVPVPDATLLAVARRWMGNAADAEDMVQDAWLRMLEREPLGLHEPRAWLTTVMQRLAIDQLRRRKVESAALATLSSSRTSVEIASEPSTEQAVALRRRCREALMHLASRLSPLEAAVLLLHEVFGHDHEQIGGLAGKSEAACRQVLHRALRRLKGPASERRRDAADFEAVYAHACLAIETHQAQPLHVLLQPTAPTVCVTQPAEPVASQSAPAVCSSLALVAGRWVVRVEQGGVLLCLLPLGVWGAEDCPTAAVASQQV